MEEFNDLIYQSLNRYFNVVEKLGYVPEEDVNKLVLLQYLRDFLIQYDFFITENDYAYINKVIDCLSNGTCLIPYMPHIPLSLPSGSYVNDDLLRLTELDVIRINQLGDMLRLVNL